jgi:replicative DNA helicase
MKPSSPIYRLKQKARKISRSRGIPLHAALDQVAAEEGYKSWSLLVVKAPVYLPAQRVYAQLAHGDLLLTGARPGQGKTLFSLKLAAEAMNAGYSAYFFTLEYTRQQVADRLQAIGLDDQDVLRRFIFDGSDEISADYIVERLADAPAGTLAIIDYLQLLDQRRDKPELAVQVGALRAFAKDKGVTMVFIAQIDRAYESLAKAIPDFADVRLPNPLDLSVFDKACFLSGGDMRLVQTPQVSA